MHALIVVLALAAQNGDVKGEEQPPLRDEWRVPIARALSPEEELATFVVDEGLKVELVACEPLVVAPVCATFDERGRLWVCEMRSYMRDADGTGESDAVNAVVVLTDTDGDGRMDKRDVFLDELVLPRAVAPTRDGALIIAPPNLLFARDTDGDGRADDVRVLETGLQGIASPEHAINGLLYTLDNWFVCANAPLRFRWNGDKLERGRTAGGGQWGITEDRWGRIFYNDNSNPLRCDTYPSHYAVRNPNLGVAPGMGVDIAKGSRPNPSHKTPGVNRGYRGNLLVDGRLNEFTGACAPWIYEGDALPERYQGDAFVAEPCGNLVHHFELTYDASGMPTARTAPPDGAFLTSTDERFRPVFLNEGPDGALYVVDMYRGVLQHRLFVTSWLRKQMEERELEEPIDRGRIWRVTRANAKREPMPNLVDCSWTELARQLGSANRWMRKTAQRLFVEEGQGDPLAREVLSAEWDQLPHPEGTLNWLWARDALGISEEREIRFLSYFQDVPTRAHESFLLGRLAERGDATASRSLRSAMRMSEQIPLERLLAAGTSRDQRSFDAMLELLPSRIESELKRSALVSGLGGREIEFLRGIVSSSHWPSRLTSDQRALVRMLVACVVRDGRAQRVEALLDMVADDATKDDYVEAIVEGLKLARGKDARGQHLAHRVARQPRCFEAFERTPALAERLRLLGELFIWPGKLGTEGLFPRELDATERQRFERGRTIFEQNCASCHQMTGFGDPSLAPPLRNSPVVLGDADRLARIVMHGLRGPITFDGVTWDGEMPSFAADDIELASVLTFLRREWNHTADPIDPDFVAAVRARYAERRGPWHTSELDLR